MLFDLASEFNAESNYPLLHSLGMEPRKLLGLLMERDGDNTHSLARKLPDGPSQSQIYKFLHGQAKEPRRSTLAPLIAHYGLDREAFYDPEVAEREARRLALVKSAAADQEREKSFEPGSIPPEYRQLIEDLEVLGPTLESEFRQKIHEAAEHAREAIVRQQQKTATAALAHERRDPRRSVASLTYGDGNERQGSLPLTTVADPFKAAPSERESALYRKIRGSPKSPGD